MCSSSVKQNISKSNCGKLFPLNMHHAVVSVQIAHSRLYVITISRRSFGNSHPTKYTSNNSVIMNKECGEDGNPKKTSVKICWQVSLRSYKKITHSQAYCDWYLRTTAPLKANSGLYWIKFGWYITDDVYISNAYRRRPNKFTTHRTFIQMGHKANVQTDTVILGTSPIPFEIENNIPFGSLHGVSKGVSKYLLTARGGYVAGKMLNNVCSEPLKWYFYDDTWQLWGVIDIFVGSYRWA